MKLKQKQKLKLLLNLACTETETETSILTETNPDLSLYSFGFFVCLGEQLIDVHSTRWYRIKESKNQRIKEFIFPTGLQFPH